MTKQPPDCLSLSRELLRAIVARLDPVLTPHGFSFHSEYNGVSSGGAFTNGFYVRLPIKIGLIVRGEKLGCPNYDWNEYQTGHNELIERLGSVKDSVLRFDSSFDKWELVTIDGRDVIDAFVADIETIILPAMINTPEKFAHAVITSHESRLARWSN